VAHRQNGTLTRSAQKNADFSFLISGISRVIALEIFNVQNAALYLTQVATLIIFFSKGIFFSTRRSQRTQRGRNTFFHILRDRRVLCVKNFFKG
jgi:uncharacterized membrane protein SirB2